MLEMLVNPSPWHEMDVELMLTKLTRLIGHLNLADVCQKPSALMDAIQSANLTRSWPSQLGETRPNSRQLGRNDAVECLLSLNTQDLGQPEIKSIQNESKRKERVEKCKKKKKKKKGETLNCNQIQECYKLNREIDKMINELTGWMLLLN